MRPECLGSRHHTPDLFDAIVFGMLLSVGSGLVSTDAMRSFFDAPMVAILHLFTSRMMSIAVMPAFLLNLIFRIGATRSVTFEFEDADMPVADIEKLLRARGRGWSVPSDAIDRAVGTTEQVMRHLVDASLMTGSPSVTMTYNDVDLTISIHYQGVLLSLPNVGIRKHFLMEEESFSYGLAAFLTGVYPDRMEARSAGEDAEIRLIFSG